MFPGSFGGNSVKSDTRNLAFSRDKRCHEFGTNVGRDSRVPVRSRWLEIMEQRKVIAAARRNWNFSRSISHPDNRGTESKGGRVVSVCTHCHVYTHNYAAVMNRCLIMHAREETMPVAGLVITFDLMSGIIKALSRRWFFVGRLPLRASSIMRVLMTYLKESFSLNYFLPV